MATHLYVIKIFLNVNKKISFLDFWVTNHWPKSLHPNFTPSLALFSASVFLVLENLYIFPIG